MNNLAASLLLNVYNTTWAPIDLMESLGLVPPLWLLRGTMHLTAPMFDASLRLRGISCGVSGS